MKIAIGNDHTALEMKAAIKAHLEEKGYEVLDLGTNSTDSCDYPVYGEKVGRAVVDGEADLGIAICGTGVGISLAANKVKGVRACVCSEPYTAKLSRMHNDSNVLAFGARVVGVELAKIERYINEDFEVKIDNVWCVGQGFTAAHLLDTVVISLRTHSKWEELSYVIRNIQDKRKTEQVLNVVMPESSETTGSRSSGWIMDMVMQAEKYLQRMAARRTRFTYHMERPIQSLAAIFCIQPVDIWVDIMTRFIRLKTESSLQLPKAVMEKQKISKRMKTVN